MRITMTRTEKEFHQLVSRTIAKQIIAKPTSILGLDVTLKSKATFETLVNISSSLGLDWSEAKICATYEFVDTDENNVCSVVHRLHFELLNHININKDSVFVPEATAQTVNFACDNFAAAIKSFGGADLAVLELSPEGAVAFNTAERSIDKIAYKRDVEPLDFNSKAKFTGNFYPEQVITTGMKQLMNSKEILLLAQGKDVAKAARTVLLGEVNAAVPASLLQLHPNVTVVLDEDSASMMW